jgi:hypothetical protein
LNQLEYYTIAALYVLLHKNELIINLDDTKTLIFYFIEKLKHHDTSLAQQIMTSKLLLISLRSCDNILVLSQITKLKNIFITNLKRNKTSAEYNKLKTLQAELLKVLIEKYNVEISEKKMSSIKEYAAILQSS